MFPCADPPGEAVRRPHQQCPAQGAPSAQVSVQAPGDGGPHHRLPAGSFWRQTQGRTVGQRHRPHAQGTINY